MARHSRLPVAASYASTKPVKPLVGHDPDNDFSISGPRRMRSRVRNSLSGGLDCTYGQRRRHFKSVVSVIVNMSVSEAAR
jgi:hypothetical protein